MDSVNTKHIQILETDGYQKCLQKYNSKYLSFLSTIFAHVKPTATSIEILCYLFFANITAMKWLYFISLRLRILYLLLLYVCIVFFKLQKMRERANTSLVSLAFCAGVVMA